MSQPPQPLITEKSVQEKPWRYIGYRGFSEWLASDDDFFVLRRFDVLSARTLLFLQWQLSKLESQLSEADELRAFRVVADLNNGSFEADDQERQALLLQIKEHLTEYYTFLNLYSEVKNKPQSTKESIRNVKNWLENHPRAIHEAEVEFADFQDDLVNIHTTGRSPVRRWLEKIPFFRQAKIFARQRETLSEIPSLHDPTRTIYHRDRRLNNTVDALTCAGGFVVLVTPLWILLFVSSNTYQLAVITLFSAFFLILVQSVSSARPYESLAATAAYTAVLMVFMQINSGGHG